MIPREGKVLHHDPTFNARQQSTEKEFQFSRFPCNLFVDDSLILFCTGSKDSGVSLKSLRYHVGMFVTIVGAQTLILVRTLYSLTQGYY